MNVVMGIPTASVVGGILLVGFPWRVWKDETQRRKELNNKKTNNEVTCERNGERSKEVKMNQLETGRKNDKRWLGRNK